MVTSKYPVTAYRWKRLAEIYKRCRKFKDDWPANAKVTDNDLASSLDIKEDTLRRYKAGTRQPLRDAVNDHIHKLRAELVVVPLGWLAGDLNYADFSTDNIGEGDLYRMGQESIARSFINIAPDLAMVHWTEPLINNLLHSYAQAPRGKDHSKDFRQILRARANQLEERIRCKDIDEFQEVFSLRGLAADLEPLGQGDRRDLIDRLTRNYVNLKQSCHERRIDIRFYEGEVEKDWPYWEFLDRTELIRVEEVSSRRHYRLDVHHSSMNVAFVAERLSEFVEKLDMSVPVFFQSNPKPLVDALLSLGVTMPWP